MARRSKHLRVPVTEGEEKRYDALRATVPDCKGNPRKEATAEMVRRVLEAEVARQGAS